MRFFQSAQHTEQPPRSAVRLNNRIGEEREQFARCCFVGLPAVAFENPLHHPVYCEVRFVDVGEMAVGTARPAQFLKGVRPARRGRSRPVS
jgi:hypothetical protein